MKTKITTIILTSITLNISLWGNIPPQNAPTMLPPAGNPVLKEKLNFPDIDLDLSKYVDLREGLIAHYPFSGNSDYNSVQSTLDYWINFNNTSVNPTISTYSDQGMIIEHYLYDDGDNNVSVEYYKYILGGHEWFNNSFQGQNTSELIWNFVSKYNINGLIE